LANDIRTFRQHWFVGIDFPSLDELVRMSAEVVSSAAEQWREMTTSAVVEQ
jgi:hypothetical protein